MENIIVTSFGGLDRPGLKGKKYQNQEKGHTADDRNTFSPRGGEIPQLSTYIGKRADPSPFWVTKRRRAIPHPKEA